MPGATVVWFRHELRVEDNPALAAAAALGEPVLPVFVWAPEEEGDWPLGGASRWWLHHSLESLAKELRTLGARLCIRQGKSLTELRKLVRETGACRVFWNRRYEPAVIQRDKQIKQTLRDAGLTAESFNAALLHEPWEVLTRQQQPYQVFSPYWRACQEQPVAEPLPAPEKLKPVSPAASSLPLDELELLPQLDWADGFPAYWQPGAEGAKHALTDFLGQTLGGYEESRQRPDLAGTSRLSPHLHFGEMSVRTAWFAAQKKFSRMRSGEAKAGAERFFAELGWREFSHQLLFHYPHTPLEPLRPPFKNFPWESSQRDLRAWQRGRTGYPMVDAGMRELWATGWMHNRVRMVTASFLTKHLLLPWQEGARWFWDTLVDANLANNTLGWQWTAGCGADAAPYFRIFNPVTQGEKFDPDGDYVRTWVPELSQLATRWIHQPWQAPHDELKRAGVKLGETYPRPIVEHSEARERALAAYGKLA